VATVVQPGDPPSAADPAGGGPAGTSGSASGASAPERVPRRSTPFRLGAWSAAVGVCIALLLGVTVAAMTAARDGAATVASRAASASEASDLYFALADLDTEAARLVLLGNGIPPGGTTATYGGNQLTALIAYNQRNAQIDGDLAALAASEQPGDAAAVTALAQDISTYRGIAAGAVAMDDSANEHVGAAAGAPLRDATGYYSRATSIMQGQILPEARALNTQKAAQLADAAHSANLAGTLGAIGAGVVGAVAVIAALAMHRRMARWFRRRINPFLVLAALVSAALGISAAASLALSASDSSDAGSRFASYLTVTYTQTDSYTADGDAVRLLVLAGVGSTTTHTAVTTVSGELQQLGPDPLAQEAATRWQAAGTDDILGTNDRPGIVGDAKSGDTAAALARDTGIGRGDEAFDFSYYDLALSTLAGQRLASFQAASAADGSALAGWSWLPWAFAVASLAALGLGVRSRFAEYR
jgi:hypothetical protein